MSEENSSAQLKNGRRHVRTTLRSRIKLIHPLVGEIILHTNDLSDSGVFVVAEGQELPRLGETVHIQVQDLPVEAPIIEAKIVRRTDIGAGLEFIRA